MIMKKKRCEKDRATVKKGYGQKGNELHRAGLGERGDGIREKEEGYHTRKPFWNLPADCSGNRKN